MEYRRFDPALVIVEEPKQRGMRFRYQCEGRATGSIFGERSDTSTKTYPTVQVQNYSERVLLRVSLVSKEEPYRPHPHALVGTDCNDGIFQATLEPPDLRVQFQNLGIQCAKRKDIMSAIRMRVTKQKIDPFNVGGLAFEMEGLDLNAVRFCFEAFLINSHGSIVKALPPVVSNPIYDKKGCNTSELKIIRLNEHSGCAAGGDERYILCDKVQKEDIAVRFFDEDAWEARGVFSQTDVHRQVAIVFRTPPYRDGHTAAPVCVRVQLLRPSDGETSEPLEFHYTPVDTDPHHLQQKRKKKHSAFQSCAAEASQGSWCEQNGESSVATCNETRRRLKVKLQQHKEPRKPAELATSPPMPVKPEAIPAFVPYFYPASPAGYGAAPTGCCPAGEPEPPLAAPTYRGSLSLFGPDATRGGVPGGHGGGGGGDGDGDEGINVLDRALATIDAALKRTQPAEQYGWHAGAATPTYAVACVPPRPPLSSCALGEEGPGASLARGTPERPQSAGTETPHVFRQLHHRQQRPHEHHQHLQHHAQQHHVGEAFLGGGGGVFHARPQTYTELLTGQVRGGFAFQEPSSAPLDMPYGLCVGGGVDVEHSG
ncbi:proto-oncogene c-Rel [Lampetra planeri]